MTQINKDTRRTLKEYGDMVDAAADLLDEALGVLQQAQDLVPDELRRKMYKATLEAVHTLDASSKMAEKYRMTGKLDSDGDAGRQDDDGDTGPDDTEGGAENDGAENDGEGVWLLIPSERLGEFCGELHNVMQAYNKELRRKTRKAA